MKRAPRLFIALSLPEAWRQELGRSLEQLASRRDRVSWVRREHLHLSLRFLGETEERFIPLVDDLLAQLARHHAAPLLRLGEPGIFGAPTAPRVLWMGLAGQLRELEELAASLERGLRRLGLPAAEHAFKPHLTLGRVKQCREDLALVHLRHPPLPLEAHLGRLELLESRLRPEGPEYDVLTRHILSTNEDDDIPAVRGKHGTTG